MSWQITVFIRGSTGDRTLHSVAYADKRAAEKDMTRIKSAQRLYADGNHAQARKALPSWIPVSDVGLIVGGALDGNQILAVSRQDSRSSAQAASRAGQPDLSKTINELVASLPDPATRAELETAVETALGALTVGLLVDAVAFTKENCIEHQQFESAAKFRDLERRLVNAARAVPPQEP